MSPGVGQYKPHMFTAILHLTQSKPKWNLGPFGLNKAFPMQLNSMPGSDPSFLCRFGFNDSVFREYCMTFVLHVCY
jgi:hypothetical protein